MSTYIEVCLASLHLLWEREVHGRCKSLSIFVGLQEGNVKLRLTIVSTQGYGDQIDKSDSIKPILDYIDAQFEGYLQEELKIKRDLVEYHDSRIHACLYFISPTGHS